MEGPDFNQFKPVTETKDADFELEKEISDIEEGVEEDDQLVEKGQENKLEKQEYQWFVEPLDSHTNEVIARLLEQDMGADLTTITDEHGETKEAFIVEHKHIQALENSKKQQNLRFRKYNRKGKDGKIREWKFTGKKKTRKEKKALEDLERIKENK
jgi:hypothetical protein